MKLFSAFPTKSNATAHSALPYPSRFLYGYLRGVIQHRSCPVKVHLKVVESDKNKMVSNLKLSREETQRQIHSSEASSGAETPVNVNIGGANANGNTGSDGETRSSLPPLLHKDEPTGEGWITFEKPVMFLFAGKGPYVGRDLMQFPVSHPDDGYIDVAIQEMVCRIIYPR